MKTVAMDIVWKQIVYTCLVLLLLLASGQGKDKMKEKCNTCKDITAAFKQGLRRTAKSNFGGGNTKWEEKSLGKYKTSETRFVEIQERLCEDSSEDKQCHMMVEEHEDLLEYYWFKVFGQDIDKSLYEWLCLEKIKVCCPNGTYGNNCSSCPGGKDTPCYSHGDCDGDGTRGGTGKCLCHSEYTGEHCTECREGYYEAERNATYLRCEECHISCKNCTGPDAINCTECREGYEKSDVEGCSDINECETQTSPCNNNQYCSNTVGSFVCMACDEACDRCLGAGPDKCVKCKVGFQMKDGKCDDVNECDEEGICKGDLNVCVNTPGSYRCDCKKDYELVGDQCVPKTKEDVEEEEEGKGEKTDDTDTVPELPKDLERDAEFLDRGLPTEDDLGPDPEIASPHPQDRHEEL